MHHGSSFEDLIEKNTVVQADLKSDKPNKSYHIFLSSNNAKIGGLRQSNFSLAGRVGSRAPHQNDRSSHRFFQLQILPSPRIRDAQCNAVILFYLFFSPAQLERCM